MAKDFLYCEATDTTIRVNDIVSIASYDSVKWITRKGWYKLGNSQRNGWYFLSIVDKSILPADQVNLISVTKDIEQSNIVYRPTQTDEIEKAPEYQYIVIPNTDIRIYDGDTVKISNKPRLKWIAHSGWYFYENVQHFGWYFESIKDGTTLPISVVDLTLVSLATVRTQGSTKNDGKSTKYTRPFTEADAEVLNRTFITLDTIKQRDNLDPNKLINGRIVRVNNVDGAPAYYVWDSDQSEWLIVEDNNQGIPELIGTTQNPIILSKLQEGLYRVKGTYLISEKYEMITLSPIDHIIFVRNDNDNIQIKVITDTEIVDYLIEEEEVTFVNPYATRKYLEDNYATLYYVNEKVAALEAEISEIMTEFKDKVTAVTGIGTGTAAAQTITVGSNDPVTAITDIGTGTAAAQTFIGTEATHTVYPTSST